MPPFAISIQSEDPALGPDDPRQIAIRVGQAVLTRLLRLQQTEPDDYLRAPPSPLAFWLVDNWWRLRWECVPSSGLTPEWRLAHDLSSIGGGYIWPRCSIFGESDRIGFIARSDPAGIIGPVRYLTDALIFVPATAFENAVDQFLNTASSEILGYGSDRAALRELVVSLRTERDDAALSDWRRLEARLGFNPDRAPASLMESLAALSERYGKASVEEAAMAAPGTSAFETLKDEIAAAKASRMVCDFTSALEAAYRFHHETADPPWISAERVAQQVRDAFGINGKPLKNIRLRELLGVSTNAFTSMPTSFTDRLSYGLRLQKEDSRTNIVALRSRVSRDRRFELARALGDAIWSGSDALGPVAKTSTARQKFQRAFAQSLLCPFESLIEYLGTENPREEDISAAAQFFHVSERVVQTVLVNKHIIQQARFEDMTRTIPTPPPMSDTIQIENTLEAA